MGVISDHLREKVYHQLNAYEEGFLDTYSPIASSGKTLSYSLTCPQCKVPKAAFYYPGSGWINCHRKNNCGIGTTVFDAIQMSTGGTNAEIFKLLCDATGSYLETDDAPGVAADSPRFIRKSVSAILQGFLWKSDESLTYLRSRSLSDEDIRSLGIGYYPSESEVRKELSSAGVDIPTAEQWMLIQPSTAASTQKKRWMLDRRIVGLWDQADGTVRLWGRTLVEGDGPKYYFSPGLDKSQPYGWRGGSTRLPIVVEGTFDRDSLALMGFNSLAIGGAGINAAQALFLAEHKVLDLIHMIDGDRAGREGAYRTITNCEPLGITTYIATTPEGADDVDALRQAGKKDDVEQIIGRSVLGGEYIAFMALLALDKGGPKSGAAVREAIKIKQTLTLPSQLAFEKVFNAYGLGQDDVEGGAIRTALHLHEAGMGKEAITQRLAETHGITITIGNVEHPPKSESSNG